MHICECVCRVPDARFVRRALFFLAHVAESVTSSAALAANAYAYASDSSSNQSTATFLRPLLSLFVAVVGTRAVPRSATEDATVRADSAFSDEIVGDQEVKEKVRPVPLNIEIFASVTCA
jgi:hypothetical protein